MQSAPDTAQRKTKRSRSNCGEKTVQSTATGHEKAITGRDLLKILQSHTKLDLPVVVIDDENPAQGYRTVRAISTWFNGCPVIHVGKK
jgi:hypothetical protein